MEQPRNDPFLGQLTILQVLLSERIKQLKEKLHTNKKPSGHNR